MGIHANQAYGLLLLRNQVGSNLFDGIHAEEESIAFEVGHNTIYENGHHGITFSDRSINNQIHDNELYGNQGHGIVLSRGTNNNSLTNNQVYNNHDGLMLFQSSDNIMQGNSIRDNLIGVRIHASYEADQPFDYIATNNQISSNIIQNNRQYGIYLYDRADRNLINDNTIIGSGFNGVYIKSGGNQIRNNSISSNGHGISILGGLGRTSKLEANASPIAALEAPGHHNIISGNTIIDSSGAGIRLMGAVGNRIGQDAANPLDEDSNLIEANGTDGIVIRDGSTGRFATDNVVLGNTIQSNGRHGVLIQDATSLRNTISRNSITNNQSRGIKITDQANNHISPPRITIINPDTGYIGGQSFAHAVIEVYRDVDGEGQIYEGQTVADGEGFWGFTLFVNPYSATAIAIDGNGNSSGFSGGKSFVPSYTVEPDRNGQLTIRVKGRHAVVTLQDIRNGLGGYAYLLEDLGNGVWQLNANLRIQREVTLNLTSSSGVRELRLRSENPINEEEADKQEIEYSSFVSLRTDNGTINIDGVKIYSWDPQVGDYDHEIKNGRSYILAKYTGELNIRNAEISYLGSADGESYGISWRDVNDPARPDFLRTRVTGEMINSRVHHNYYGVYTFQASGMSFKHNLFYDNIRYGFDPHDYTHDVVVEHNEAYNNGSHGFIISRGCQDFIFSNNKSFNNHDSTDSLAHGFMLDPGSPNSVEAQFPSSENVLENNQAYDNEGYGLRILGSTNNTVRHNHFHDNLNGIVVDPGSINNLLSGNMLTNNMINGIFVRGGADRTRIINNIARGNENHGIYIRSNHNRITHNTSRENLGTALALALESDDITTNATFVEGNDIRANTLTDNKDDGMELKGVVNNIVQNNIIEGNAVHGIYLSDGASKNHFFGNMLRSNSGVGIRMSGNGTFGNTWSENQLYDNEAGGIDMTTSINNQIEPPLITDIEGQQITGTANPGSLIEIFSDHGGQGRYFEGRTIATSDGRFSFTVSNPWQGSKVTAIATDAMGNSSGFAISKTAPARIIKRPSIIQWMNRFTERFFPQAPTKRPSPPS